MFRFAFIIHVIGMEYFKVTGYDCQQFETVNSLNPTHVQLSTELDVRVFDA